MPTPPPAAQAAAYLRVSTEEQTEFSPEAQLRALETYAAAHGLTLDPRHIFRDEGISGRRAETRPGFMAMIRAARSPQRPFDVILVHRFDRFARSREDSVVYKSMLRRECGVRVISVTESIEEDKFSGILEAMLEAMAEYYSLNLSDEVKKGMTEKARRGGLQTAPPFGYRARDNVLVPQAEESALVRWIFSAYAEGASFRAIAQGLCALGARTRRGGLFSSRSVGYVLKNPVYLGLLRWDPGTGPIVAPGKHPPLVDRAVWDAVQARLPQSSSGAPSPKPPEEKRHWLQGILRCAACGSVLKLYPAGKGQRLYTRCQGYARGKCDQGQHFPLLQIEEVLLARLDEDTARAGGLKLEPCLSHSAREEQAALQGQRALVQRKRERLMSLFLAEELSPAEYRAALRTLERAEADLAAPRPLFPETKAGFSPPDRPSVLFRDPALDTAAKARAAAAILDRCELSRRPEPRVHLVYRPVFAPCVPCCPSVDPTGSWAPPSATSPSGIPCPIGASRGL